jgi:hypothetical protein
MENALQGVKIACSMECVYGVCVRVRVGRLASDCFHTWCVEALSSALSLAASLKSLRAAAAFLAASSSGMALDMADSLAWGGRKTGGGQGAACE